MMSATERPPRRGQMALDLGYEPSHAEDDFIVGEGNELAYGHVIAFPDWAGPMTLLQGPAKSGKSHLARIWAERAGAGYAQPQTAEELSRQGGSAPLVIEDADRAGYDEPALFHLLNQSMRDRRPLLMTARHAVADWPFLTPDLKSRARLAALFHLQLSDDIQLSQMLVKLFADRQLAVDPKVIAYLVARMERSPHEAVILADTLDRLALERGTAVTRALAAEVLAERDGRNDRSQLALDLEGEDDE